jgi:uncharacterized Zn finger protein
MGADTESWDEGVLEGIVARADDKVRARGQAIARGDIPSISRDGSRIRARVRGSDIVPYRVDIDASSGEAACTCPYDWGEVCKHAVAVALLALNDGESIEESSLKSRLAIDLSGASEDDAIAILEELRQKFPRAVREFVAEQMQEFEHGDPDDVDDY